MTDKKLEIKIGEIWQVADCNDTILNNIYDKRIIYVASKRIIAKYNDLHSDETHVYNLDGTSNSGSFKLYRRKPEIKKLECKVYRPVYKDLGDTNPYLGGTYNCKSKQVEEYAGFIKWLELSGEVEVEI